MCQTEEMPCERGEKGALEAQTGEVNNIVLQADTSPSTAAIAVSGSVPAARLSSWRPDMHQPASMGACEKHPAVENQVSRARIALLPAPEQAKCWCTFENRQKGSSVNVLRCVGAGGGVRGQRGNQMPIDFNASSVRDDFLRYNGWRMEK